MKGCGSEVNKVGSLYIPLLTSTRLARSEILLLIIIVFFTRVRNNKNPHLDVSRETAPGPGFTLPPLLSTTG